MADPSPAPEWHVPKKELVSTIQLLLQRKRIKFAPLPLRKTLQDELHNFKVKISLAAKESFESWPERDHDVLVLAVVPAAWLGEGHVPLEVPIAIDTPQKRLLHERVLVRSF